MPKISGRHKRGRRTGVTPAGAPRAIGELLARSTPVMSQIGDQSTRQAFWQTWLTKHLPEELAAHLTGAVELDGALTLFADSSAWAARLRYALRELQPSMQGAEPNIRQVKVRVLPRS